MTSTKKKATRAGKKAIDLKNNQPMTKQKQINMWCHLFFHLDGIQQKLCGGNIVGVKTFNVDQQLSNKPAGNVAKQ